MNIYEIIKDVIERKDYELSDILSKIEKRCFENLLTEEQRDELVAKARENANPLNSYAPLQEQIEKLALEVKVLREEVANLKNGGTTDEEITDEYPEYVQPTGGHDSYKIGDKVTFEGKKYECLMNGCVWTPKAYPQGWKLVKEAVEDLATEEETE